MSLHLIMHSGTNWCSPTPDQTRNSNAPPKHTPPTHTAGGISLIVIPRETPGFERSPLRKMGWLSSDTATLYFNNCRVPAANIVGRENDGFKAIMVCLVC